MANLENRLSLKKSTWDEKPATIIKSHEMFNKAGRHVLRIVDGYMAGFTKVMRKDYLVFHNDTGPVHAAWIMVIPASALMAHYKGAFKEKYGTPAYPSASFQQYVAKDGRLFIDKYGDTFMNLWFGDFCQNPDVLIFNEGKKVDFSFPDYS